MDGGDLADSCHCLVVKANKHPRDSSTPSSQLQLCSLDWVHRLPDGGASPYVYYMSCRKGNGHVVVGLDIVTA